MTKDLLEINKLIRYNILTSTTTAGSGHPSSSLSATDVLGTLLFGGYFKSDIENPENINNDRLIFSKGHASPLFYSLYSIAGKVTQSELKTLRQFNSRLEGHPTMCFPYTEAATGSLGQGLSIGVGMALDAKLEKLDYKTFVLLGDSEMAEGSNWEAMQITSHYKLDNLIAIIDVNRLGQRGETMEGWDTDDYKTKCEAFGWKTIVINGHNLDEIERAFKIINGELITYTVIEKSLESEKFKQISNFGEIQIISFSESWGSIVKVVVEAEKDEEFAVFLSQNLKSSEGWYADSFNSSKKVIYPGKIFTIKNDQDLVVAKAYGVSLNIPISQLDFDTINQKPTVIIAKTIKGKGVSFIENNDGWHGKALSEEQLQEALKELGKVQTNMVAEITKPKNISNAITEIVQNMQYSEYDKNIKTSTRKAYGNALVKLGRANPKIVVLDAETSNSTFAIDFKKEFPDRFFEMYIAEQNMVGTALGFSRRGKIPFVSTFAAFFSRAFDQIRMSQYSQSNIKFVGSHAGVSIGEDGSSQMALEDIAMFRAVSDMTVLYPSDAVSTEKLLHIASQHFGNVFIRTTRADTKIIYNINEEFEIGGSKTFKQTKSDEVTIISAGITLHEALGAWEILQTENINVRIIDLYSIKPLDKQTIFKACQQTKALIVVEDHYQEGGIYEAVCGSGVVTIPVHSLAVRKMSRSGKPQELLEYMEIDRNAIVKKVKSILGK